MSKNITVLQGGQAGFQVYRGDSAATSASLLMKNDETNAVYTVTANYIDGIAGLSIDGDQTGIVGTYSYQINENIPGEDPVKYGDLGCSDCELPKIYVCESVDGVS